MSVVGTFLVRSGVLTSVHAFAIDPQRGTFLLALLAIYVGAAFTLFAIRAPRLREGAPFVLVSRESGLVVNNLLLTVVLGIVFLGTLYPLFVEAISGEKLSVGAPYFNAVAGPLALLLAVLVGVGPLLSWRHDRKPVVKRLTVPALLGVTALIITFFLAPSMTILPRLGLTIATFLAVASPLPLIGRNLLRTPVPTWGMVISHFGISVALAGMAANGAFTSERLAVARPGEQLSVGPWQVAFGGVMPSAGKNFTTLDAELRASRGDGVVVLHPETHYFSDPPTETNEAAIRTFWDGQLYTVVGREDPNGGWQLRLWWKPFVTLIWSGGALVAIGGALALLGRALRGWRAGRPRPEPDWRKRYI
jgi:cytochrome c-type biogenesis protein CcmF